MNQGQVFAGFRSEASDRVLEIFVAPVKFVHTMETESAANEATVDQLLERLQQAEEANDVALIGAGWAQCKLFKLDAASANFDKALVSNSHNPKTTSCLRTIVVAVR